MSTQLIAASPKDLLQYLEKSKSAIQMALPKHLTPERMMRLALTAFSTTPALRKCTAQSILSSVVVASQIGLEIGIAGQGYLVPYGTTATFVPGWQGLVGLLNNTGRATAWTGSVFDGDLFEFELGSNPHIKHVPGENYGDPSKILWVYACGKVNGSELPVIEAWPIKRVWKHRDQFNKVGQRHYSYENPEMYARKVVLLQVLKYMPRSIELNNAITASDAAENGRQVRVDGGTIVEVEEVPNDQPAETETRRTRGSRTAVTETQAQETQQEQPADVERSQADIEKAEKQNLLTAIRETFNEFDEMNESKFEGLCRKLGLMAPTSMLGTLSLAKLRVIHDNRGDIINGNYKVDGGE